MVDQRKTPRKLSRIRVLCRTADAEMEGSLSDIGTGGAYLELSDHLETGTRVSLRIEMPIFPEPLSIRGTVIGRRSENSVGVSFDPLSDVQRRSLNLLFWG